MIEIRVVGEIHQPEILNGEWQLSTDDPLIFLIRLLVHQLAMPISISSIVDPGNDIVPLCIKCYNNIMLVKILISIMAMIFDFLILGKIA